MAETAGGDQQARRRLARLPRKLGPSDQGAALVATSTTSTTSIDTCGTSMPRTASDRHDHDGPVSFAKLLRDSMSLESFCLHA